MSDDGRYLILTVWQGTDVRNRLFYQDLQSGGPVVELIPDLEAAYYFVGNDGPLFYFRTDLDAPRGRLIAVDTTRPDKAAWRTLIAESADTLELVTMVHDEFVALYLHDGYHLLKRFDRQGRLVGRHCPADARLDPKHRRVLQSDGPAQRRRDVLRLFVLPVSGDHLSLRFQAEGRVS